MYNMYNMYRSVIRNFSVKSKNIYIPSKNKTWTYKNGYYKNNIKINRTSKKISFVSENLPDNIKHFYDNKYKS